MTMKLLPQEISNKLNYCVSEKKQCSSYDNKSWKKTDAEIAIKSVYGTSADLNLHLENKFYKGCIILMFGNILLSCFMVSYGFYLSSGQTLIYSDIDILKKQVSISIEAEIQLYQTLITVESMFKTLLEVCQETVVIKSKEVLNDFVDEWRNLYEKADENHRTNKSLVFNSLVNLLHEMNNSQLTATMQQTPNNLSYVSEDKFISKERYNTTFNYVDNEKISDEIEDFTGSPNFAIPINNFNIDDDDDDSLSSEDSSHLRRPKRSNRRGKEPERRPSNGGGVRQRKKKQLRAPEAIHFKGGQPEIFVRDGGLVAPWFYNDATSSNFTLKTVQLKQGKGAVEVTEDALYLIYSQVYYLTSNAINSYTLNLKHGSQTNSTVLAYCSAVAPNGSLSEISCYTSVVQFLKAEDRIFIQQRDMNRRIILRDGYSFLGIVRLSG